MKADIFTTIILNDTWVSLSRVLVIEQILVF